MKERVDSTKMLREPSVNGPTQDTAVAGGITKLDSVDIKAEVKEEEAGRKSNDSRPPSRKIPNGDSDNTMAIKSEDNNNKRIKVEKKADNNGKTENGKPGSVGTDSQKASPQASTPQHPSSGGTTPATVIPSQHGMMTSLEPPFMQQQSEIFVFSTTMANQAAESVRHGQFKNIIQFHMEQPNTKAFLQKNPLKSNNFRLGVPPNMMGGTMKGQHQGPSMMRIHGPVSTSWGPQQQHGPSMDDPTIMGPGGMIPNGPYTPGGPGSRILGGWPGQSCGGPHPHPHGPIGPTGYAHGNMMDMENEMMMGGPHNSSNISSSQVPDENLTLEQRQHRSKGLAQLTKIHQMLMGGSNQQEGRQPPLGTEGHPPGPGMYPGGPDMMTSQHQAMLSQQQAMMSQGGMMPPHGMMSPQHQHMMAQQGISPYGPRGPPGMGPPGLNGKDQYQAQHDWYQIQREYYMEKQHRMQHMAASRGPHMEPGPPPSYYSSISQKHSGIGGPTSPNMNGMRMPLPPHGPHGPIGSGMDPDGMGIYGAPPDMCRPHMGMEPMPGMHGYPPHSMPLQGHLDPGYDSAMSGGMPPGMGPGPPGSGGPRHHGPMRPGHMMGPNGMMSGIKGPNQVTLHRAGNPEQFNPETMGGVVPPMSVTSGNSNNSKPPPSYAQAQKRKRGDDSDDSYTKGNLQQTPSPTKIHYHLSQFEGQELTITKQLNSAFVAGNGGDESGNAGTGGGSNSSSSVTSASGGHYNSHASSPLHGPGSNKGPHSNSSQASSRMANSPAVSNAGPSPHTGPQGPSTPHSAPLPSSAPSSGANMRLSHYDPIPLSNGVNSAPHTPNPKSSSMSNITSASLANLAKGVENLSNQMQQNMMQGGPFHSIQVQGQMTSSGNSSSSSNSNSTTNSGSSSSAATTTPPSSNSSMSTPQGPPLSSQAPSTPSVSNTYIATNMSISQVTVPNHPSMNSYISMQMQNMSTESTHMNMPPCSMQHSMGPHMGPNMMGNGPRMSHHISQSQGMMASMGPMPGGPSPGMGPSQGQSMSSGPLSSGIPPGGPMPPHRPNSSSSMPATPPTMSKGQFTSPPLPHPQMSGAGSQPMPGVTSPSFPITPSSNSSVQIQQKGQNTIQYLPANPPSAQPTAKQRSDADYTMPRFPSPIHGMDGKNPSSTLQYFPNSSPRPPMSSALSAAAAMGPEFANQATIAMHQSASMMRSSSIPDLQAMQGGPGIPPSSMGPIGPMDNPSHMVGPHMSIPGPIMGGHDPMINIGSMRPGHSPGSMRSMPPGMSSGSLECVSPIPGGYINNGPSIEQAQAQAQAHAAMMMQGNTQMPVSSPHGPIPPGGGPSPHMAPGPMGPMPGSSMHGPMPSGPHGPTMPGQSPHGPPMSVQSPHGPPMSVQSPHGPMGGTMPGPLPHGPMQGPIPGPPHNSMAGPMPPHGHMGHMHGPGMPPSGMPRHPSMGSMRMPGPSMGGMPPGPGQFGSIQYPGYQQDYYSSGPPRSHPRQIMPGMMGGPGQPYGMMSNMPGPS